MSYYAFKTRIGLTIIVSNLLLFGLILIAYLLNGFVDEEMPELFKYFLPLKTLYLTLVIKFLVNNRHPPREEDKATIDVTSAYKFLIRLLIYSHFLFLATIIICAATNLFPYDKLSVYLIWIEAIYGAFIGLIMADMYGEKD
jgi:hypothetical protein